MILMRDSPQSEGFGIIRQRITVLVVKYNHSPPSPKTSRCAIFAICLESYPSYPFKILQFFLLTLEEFPPRRVFHGLSSCRNAGRLFDIFSPQIQVVSQKIPVAFRLSGSVSCKIQIKSHTGSGGWMAIPVYPSLLIVIASASNMA